MISSDFGGHLGLHNDKVRTDSAATVSPYPKKRKRNDGERVIYHFKDVV